MSNYKRMRLGNDILVKIWLADNSTHSLDEIDWECTFSTDGISEFVVPKNKAHKVDGVFECPVETHSFNEGVLKASLRLRVPSLYFDDGYKDEIVDVFLDKTYLYR